MRIGGCFGDCSIDASMTRLPRSRYFPPADEADEHGIVSVGGDLRPAILLDAYEHGIFPWPVLDDDLPMLWWSPDPRAVLRELYAAADSLSPATMISRE